MDTPQQDHFTITATAVSTIVVALAGVFKGKNRAAEKVTADRLTWLEKELTDVRLREAVGLAREDKLREELANQRVELSIIHREFGEAREAVMTKRHPRHSVLVVVSGLGIITDVSANMELEYGWKPVELIGKTVNILVPRPHQAMHEGKIKAAAETGKKVFRCDLIELFLVNSRGEEEPVSIALVGGGTGQAASYTGIIRRRSL